jgi:SAM-dependent methyltransferase
MITRSTISQHYIKGHGVEIGAFHNPFPIHFNKCTIDYVDTKTKEELRLNFPEINFNTTFVVETNMIDDGEVLSKIKNETYDFLISSHQLEHCMSPITAIENQLRVVKKGGTLFYAIPNKYKTFDKNRPVTCFEKLEDHYAHDIRMKESYSQEEQAYWETLIIDCYDEYLLNVDHMKDQSERRKIGKDRMDKKLDIHFHTFTPKSTYDFFYRLSIIYLFEIELFFNSDHEIFLVLKKENL